ncbi:hypothetical protein Dimus_027948 [Dionaea muscipula]
MGRAPCCDKANVKKGPWSPEEDAKLKSYIEQHGTGGNWIALPQKIGLKRCGKSCRLRWLNYLRPNIKHGGFSEEEDKIICSLYISIGSRWSIIAAQLPGRTDNDIKNYWNTRLKKKLLGKQRKELQASRSKGNIISKQGGYGPNSSIVDHQYHHDQQSWLGSSTADHDHHMINSTTTTQSILPPYRPLLAADHHHHHPTSDVGQLMEPSPDHASIRKLLIKLGGQDHNSYDHHNIQDDHHQLIINSYINDHDDYNSMFNMINGVQHDPYDHLGSTTASYFVPAAHDRDVIKMENDMISLSSVEGVPVDMIMQGHGHISEYPQDQMMLSNINNIVEISRSMDSEGFDYLCSLDDHDHDQYDQHDDHGLGKARVNDHHDHDHDHDQPSWGEMSSLMSPVLPMAVDSYDFNSLSQAMTTGYQPIMINTPTWGQ